MKEVLLMGFSQNFYNLRKARQMSQMEMAKLLETSQASITAWETGARIPSPKKLQHIADTLGVPIASLLTNVEMNDEERVAEILDALHANPKIGILFDRTKKMSPKDLDAILAIANSITGENYGDY